ncbi:hypothetical protein VP01_833g4 [Puccinia sorghi]|uniref:Uncharacterized protein n=1 Tax=Puccinia sorghi TaxID=27349 RepID=A0A0L6U9L0_9BASI|nr:hypothetical protein VP01_833g4 [Puccinia sorghi]
MMLAHRSPSDHVPSRRRISSAISKLSLHKMKALVSPSTALADSGSSDTDLSEFASDSSLSVSPPPCTILNPNSQTMKNYANQRSDKIPLRQPALFPASLNFSQQTISLFESNEEDTDDQENLNFYLNDLLRGPTQPEQNARNKDTKTPYTTASKQRSFPLPGFHKNSSSSDTKPKKSCNLPNSNSMPFHHSTPTKKSVRRAESFFFRAVKPSPSTATPKPPATTPEFEPREPDYSLEITSPVLEYSKFTVGHLLVERNRLLSLPTRLDSTAHVREIAQIGEKLSVQPLEAIPEQQSIASSPALSFDVNWSHTALLLMEPLPQQAAICPRIDMVLTSSPFFNSHQSTLSESSSSQDPGTPTTTETRGMGALLFPLLATPYATMTIPETPSTCVNSYYSDHTATLDATPHGQDKFAMSTGSPGIFNPLAMAYTQQQQQSLNTPIRRHYELLSPHQLPSPLPPTSHHTVSRGPGAEMLATLEFLSDLCLKSPAAFEEHDSLLERDSLAGDDHQNSPP